VDGSIRWFTTSAGTTTTTAPANLGTVTIDFTLSNASLVTIRNTATTPAGTYYFRVTYDGHAESNVATLVISAAAAKTVNVGSQVGPMTAGVANSAVGFPVTTANIANGNHNVTLTGAPAGVSVEHGMININNGSDTLWLVGNASTKAGTTGSVRATIDGAQSNQFTLTIASAASVPLTGISRDAGASSLGVGGNIPAGLGKVLGVNFTPANATDKRVTWTSSHPAIITFGSGASGFEGSDYNSNLVNVSPTATPGAVVTLTITSVAYPSVKYTHTFTVSAAVPKSITMNTSPVSGIMIAGQTGAGAYIQYNFTTTGIAAGTYTSTATLQNAPAGVSISSVSITSGGAGNLFLRGNGAQTRGVRQLKLVIDGTVSDEFTLQIN
jgi:hypothetical protein